VLGKTGQIIAAGGVGKTMLACQLAVAIATATPWLGALEPPEAGRVLLVLGEEDAAECQRRLYYAARAAGVTPDPSAIDVLPLTGIAAPMVDTDERGNFHEGAFVAYLRDYAERGDFRLVVVDPLSRFAGKDAEKDNAAATRFVQACESIASPTRSVLISHHTNQASRVGRPLRTMDATASRGVTGLVDGARWQLALTVERLTFEDPELAERLGRIVHAGVSKTNYAVEPEPLVLRYDADNNGALVACSEDDLALIEQARQSAASGAEQFAARAEAREEVKTTRRRVQMNGDDRAVIRVVAREPGLKARELRAAVQEEIGCAPERASDAITRVGRHLVTRPGPKRSKLHYAPASADGLPEHLRDELGKSKPGRDAQLSLGAEGKGA
jgi:RecA-family ATPase